MKKILLSAVLFLLHPSPVTAEECSTAFICEVINYQRLYLDGRLQKLPARSFGFQLNGNELVPQRGGSPLGDGTLNFEITSPNLCGADGRLYQHQRNKHSQFEGDNGLVAFEYISGRMLISSHVHHDYFELAAMRCDEL